MRVNIKNAAAVGLTSREEQIIKAILHSHSALEGGLKLAVAAIPSANDAPGDTAKRMRHTMEHPETEGSLELIKIFAQRMFPDLDIEILPSLSSEPG